MSRLNPLQDRPNLPETPWRHQMIRLELEDKPGLAATSGGKVAVSLHWVSDIMREVQQGSRSLAAATHEFKGVCELSRLSSSGWLSQS